MLIQIGKLQLNLGALAFALFLPDEVNTTKIQVHFIGGMTYELDTPELVSGYKSALSSLRFGVGMPIPKGNGM